MRILLPLGLLLTCGLTIISSVSGTLFANQLLWITAGFSLVALFYFVDWRSIVNYAWFPALLYLVGVVLLVVVYAMGPLIRNVKGWLVIGPFTFQPVELAKVSLVLLFAQYFCRRHTGVAQFRYIIGSFLIFAVPAALSAIEPDMGSVAIYFGIWYAYLLLSGLPFKRILLTTGVFLAAGAIGWFFVLKPYHRERIAGFLSPEKDALGINYSVNQAKIAIGSAGWWGKGYKQGTQTQLKYLPEPATDFVLASFTEEWGWAGMIFLLGSFAALELAIIRTGLRVQHNFGKFLCMGTATLFAFQFLFNTGSATGLLPVIGVTFPFVSYGGSSILMSFFLLSLVYAIGRKT